MASSRGFLNIQSLNELTYEKELSRRRRLALGCATIKYLGGARASIDPASLVHVGDRVNEFRAKDSAHIFSRPISFASLS